MTTLRPSHRGCSRTSRVVSPGIFSIGSAGTRARPVRSVCLYCWNTSIMCLNRVSLYSWPLGRIRSMCQGVATLP
eukprot:2555780-Alexandrium_andersonii.AAC.1